MGRVASPDPNEGEFAHDPDPQTLDRMARRTRHRARALGLRLQRLPAPRRAGQGGVVGSAEPVPAPRRPHSEHRQHGQGRSQLRAGDVDARGRSARQGDVDPGDAGDAEQPGGVQPLPAGAGRAVERAVAADRGQRELSEPEGQPGLPGSARAARGHREPHHRGAQPLHQGGGRVQRAGAAVPDQPDGDDLRLRRQADLHGAGRGGDLEAADGRLRQPSPRPPLRPPSR